MFTYAHDFHPAYSTEDTCGSIDGQNGHSARFRTWYQGVTAGRSEVHVVAHSMGGFVVAHALASWMPANLVSVTTLDSPLKGRPLADWVNLLPGGLGWVDGCAGDAPRYDDLIPGSIVIKAVEGLKGPKARMFATVGNPFDLVVPNPVSHHNKAWLNTRINSGCVVDLFGHACVFFDKAAWEAIESNVRRGGRAVTSRFVCGPTSNPVGDSWGGHDQRHVRQGCDSSPG